MKRSLYRSRTFKALPALLLAVFLGAQIGLAGHLHADDSSVADCLQCQFDSGHAVTSNNNGPITYATASVNPRQSLLAVPANAVYTLKARGPPALS
jgi:hypothetical protein